MDGRLQQERADIGPSKPGCVLPSQIGVRVAAARRWRGSGIKNISDFCRIHSLKTLVVHALARLTPSPGARRR